jgi:hypothetical protein
MILKSRAIEIIKNYEVLGDEFEVDGEDLDFISFFSQRISEITEGVDMFDINVTDDYFESISSKVINEYNQIRRDGNIDDILK